MGVCKESKDKMKHLLLLNIVIICLSTSSSFAFDPPSCGDYWYYQDDSRLTFMIPDKAQHYWGSYALSTIGQEYLGKKMGSLTAFALGFLWEVKDSKTSLGTANGGVVGFSYKDLIADGVGVLSSLVNQSENVRLWLNYSTYDKKIILNIAITI